MFGTEKFIKSKLIILIFTLTTLIMLSGCTSNDEADIIVNLDGQSNRATEIDKNRIINIQLAEDLKNALLSFEYIEDALVVINLNASQTSPDDVEKVSVLLTILNDAVLSETEISSIFDMIIGVVSGITYEDISITDINLNIYKPCKEDDSTIIKDGANDEVIRVNLSDGYHIYNFECGCTYEGYWKNGLPNGQGKYTQPMMEGISEGSSIIEGYFVDGIAHGTVIYTRVWTDRTLVFEFEADMGYQIEDSVMSEEGVFLPAKFPLVIHLVMDNYLATNENW